MGSPPSSRLKRRYITWTSIFFVLVIAFLGLLKLGLIYSSDILHEMVKRETNGYYRLSFEKINIDVWSRAIKLEKVLLKPDTSQDFHALGLDNLYDLELTGLHVDLKSITSIYTDRKLTIENIRIIDPQIHIIRKKDAPDESFSLQTGNLYKEISDYLKVLRIDLFTIENADFKHSPSALALGNIDFFMGNISIDSTSRPDQKFYSESIELEIRNQTFMLDDSIHQLSFDRLLLSTVDSVLIFENLILKPISEVHGTFDEIDDKIVYDIKIPKLELRGVDYFSAYQNNYLEMKELSLTDSHIFLEEQTHSRVHQPSKKNNSILKQLIKIFDEVKIGKMRFINTNLDLKTNEDYNQNYQHVQSQRSDIVLYNFFLDSTNYHIDYGKRYFDDFDIIIKDYSSHLPDSVHTLNFELLKLSSFDSSLVFKNFKISNKGKENASDLDLSIDLPLVSLKGMNYLDVLIHKKLLIKELHLQNPTIVFENKQGKREKKVFSPDSVYSMFKTYFEVVGIKKLQLSEGMFSINKQLNFQGVDLQILNFNLPNPSNSWYDALDDIDLEMRHLGLKNRTTQMKTRHLKLDHAARRLFFDELSFNHQDRNTRASGDLSKLSVSGIDLDSISMRYFLAFDSIGLHNPRIKIEIKKPGEGGIKTGILGNKLIEIVNGQLNIEKYDGTAISLNHINTQLMIGSINHILYGQVEQIDFTFPKSHNHITINKLSLTPWRDVYVKNIEIQSIKDTLLHKVELNGRIPAITLHGLNQDVFWQQGKLEGDSLSIKATNLHLNLNKAASNLVQNQAFEMQFQKIKLEKVDLIYSDQNQTTFEKVETPQLSVTLEGFHYPYKSVLDSEHLIYSDNVILNVKNLEPTMANGDALIIRELNFNKRKGLISIDRLSFEESNNATSALFPSIKMEGLDLDAYVNQNRLKLERIRMIAPNITMNKMNREKNEQPSIINLPESVDIGYFSSKNTEVVLKDSLSSMNYAIHEGQFEVRKFYSEGEIYWDRFFDYAQFASLNGKNVSVPLGDGYQLSIDQYDLQHPKNTLSLDHINLTSDFTPSQYSSTLTSQKDWFDVSVDGISFSGLDFGRALEKREYYSEKILVEGLNALVYRDKSVPFYASNDKGLPQTILKNIDAWIYIDTLHVLGDITYREKPVNKEEIAELSFNHLDASLFNITSVESRANQPMHLFSTGRLADAANFKVNVWFDMQDPKDQFTFSGQIDEMHLRSLNKMLRPVANINIKEGYAERIDFSIVANNELARGEMNLRYNNLKIQILNPETNDLKGLSQGIKTFFANTFVVDDRNPSLFVLKPGIIFQQRDTSRAIFQYWAKSLLSGAVNSIGINKSKKEEKRYDREVDD